MVKQPFLVEQSLRYLDETGDVKKYLQPNFFRQRRIQQRDQQEMDVGNWVDAWSTMQKGEVGRRSTSSYFGTVGDPIGRCRSSDRYRGGNAIAALQDLRNISAFFSTSSASDCPIEFAKAKWCGNEKAKTQCFHCSVASCWGSWASALSD